MDTIKTMSPEQVQRLIEVARHKRNQTKEDEGRDWYARIIDNASRLSFDPNPNPLKEAPRNIPWDNISRSEYRTVRIEYIKDFARDNRDGFSAIDCLEWVNEQAQHEELIIAYETIINDLALLRREGFIISHRVTTREKVTYKPSKELL